MSTLKIAIQKSGRLSEKSLQLLEECGIKISNGERKLKAVAQNFPIEILFLRDDDIPQLILHLLNRANQAHQRNVFLDVKVMERLQQHPWPGNIRELGNLIERLVLLSREPRVDLASLAALWPDAIRATADKATTPASTPPSAATIRPYHRGELPDAAALIEAMRTHGNQSRAAQSLGMTLRQFSYRLKKLGINTPR